MGKKRDQNLGRALVKSVKKSARQKRTGDSLLHTADLNDGQEWNRLDFKSITEQTDVDAFLSIAELAGTEFHAEKLNVKFMPPSALAGVLTEEEKLIIDEAKKKHENLLRIPRRPPWDKTTTPEELLELERESFLKWRHSLSLLENTDGITLTPFEKNLEFWRQLWRVIERSNIIIQIVDARNPLLFRCEDLEAYVKEVNCNKVNMVMLNKADFLTETQRAAWAEYFRSKNIYAIFFSALYEGNLKTIKKDDEDNYERTRRTSHESDFLDDDGSEGLQGENVPNVDIEECKKDLEHLTSHLKLEEFSAASGTPSLSTGACSSNTPAYVCSSKILSQEELIEVFHTVHCQEILGSQCVTVGFVGYPNVGKSSTLNALLKDKKVSISATPGKTKHFQTHYLADDILLCDCPGLVFPGFVSTKQEMIVSGILSIDNMRDHVPPVSLVASLIPRNVFEATYGIAIPKPTEEEDPDRPPTCEELLSAFGYMRGFMTSKGMPDNPRSARYILKDYVNGKLLYCHAPPGFDQQMYHNFSNMKVKKTANVQPTPQQMRVMPQVSFQKAIDDNFFKELPSQAHFRGIKKFGACPVALSSEHSFPGSSSSEGIPCKPWKLAAKCKRNKKEKARKKYAYLDE